LSDPDDGSSLPPALRGYFPEWEEPRAEGFSEGFQAPVKAHLAVANAVRRNYGFRCALSHHAFNPENAFAEGLEVVALRPQPEGGDLHVKNFLPVALPFVSYFIAGGIVIGRHYAIFVSAALVPPEVIGALHLSGRMFVPDDPALRPDEGSLMWHARFAIERLPQGT
jgi:hypothetical protein